MTTTRTTRFLADDDAENGEDRGRQMTTTTTTKRLADDDDEDGKEVGK